jgi:hypothetical protein
MKLGDLVFIANGLVEFSFGIINVVYPEFLFSGALSHPVILYMSRMLAFAMMTLGVTSYQGYKSMS